MAARAQHVARCLSCGIWFAHDNDPIPGECRSCATGKTEQFDRTPVVGHDRLIGPDE